MKKVININFQGRVVPIEETAYDILKQYVESLRRFFSNEEGRDEIINDIEGRIAELFAETLKKGSTCITDDDVNAIIASMGRPEDFDGDEANVQSQLGAESREEKIGKSASSSSTGSGSSAYEDATVRPSRLYRDENHKLLGGVCSGIANYFGIDKLIVRILFVLGFGITFIPYLILWVAVPSSASTVIGSMRKRLFRDPDNKIIAGVCGGLASYFGINVWIPRVLFIIPFLSFVTGWNDWGMFNFPHFVSLSFSPGSILIYIILWLVIPEASSTSDKLEMKGEKVDLNSIKNTIQKDMEGFGERAKEFGKEVGERAAELGATIGGKSKEFTNEAKPVVKKASTTLGDIIVLIFKIFAYFILGCVLVALVIALFSGGVALTGLLPVKGYLINEGWQELFVWGTLVFFIWVPVIGIITFIIRRLAKIKSNSNLIRYAFVAMWLVGLFCFIGLLASLRNDFVYHNSPVENTINLPRPGVNKLELKLAKNNKYYFNNSFLHFQPFANIDEDTAYVQNVHIRILRSDNDSFQVTMLKMVNGSSRTEAETRASKMRYNVVQSDSTLLFDRGIPITKDAKFRNQTVYVTVYVPVGKRIIVRDNVGWGSDMHFEFGSDMNDWDWRNDGDNGYGWESNVEYTMTAKGLERTYPEKNYYRDNNDDNNQDNNNDNDGKQPGEPIQPAQPVKPADSGKYHYEPTQSQDTKKGEVNAEISTPQIDLPYSINIHDLASALLNRISI